MTTLSGGYSLNFASPASLRSCRFLHREKSGRRASTSAQSFAVGRSLDRSATHCSCRCREQAALCDQIDSIKSARHLPPWQARDLVTAVRTLDDESTRSSAAAEHHDERGGGGGG